MVYKSEHGLEKHIEQVLLFGLGFVDTKLYHLDSLTGFLKRILLLKKNLQHVRLIKFDNFD